MAGAGCTAGDGRWGAPRAVQHPAVQETAPGRAGQQHEMPARVCSPCSPAVGEPGETTSIAREVSSGIRSYISAVTRAGCGQMASSHSAPGTAVMFPPPLLSRPSPPPRERPAAGNGTSAAYAAGLATGFWSTTEELRANWNESKRWLPEATEEQRATGYRGWKKAVERTLNWVEVD